MQNLVEEIIALVVEKCLETPNPIGGEEQDSWIAQPRLQDWNQGTSRKLGELAKMLKYDS